MRYRLGRSHLDLVYRQLGDAPSDEDVRVAVFSEASVAIAVVQLLNGEVEEGAALESAYDRPPQCPAMSSTGQRCHANKGHQGTHVRFNAADGLLDYWDPAAAPAGEVVPDAWEPPAEAEKLRAALDVAERMAGEVAAQWDPARVLSLVARDRAELADHLVPPKYADDPCECIERMAAFWLGEERPTPDMRSRRQGGRGAVAAGICGAPAPVLLNGAPRGQVCILAPGHPGRDFWHEGPPQQQGLPGVRWIDADPLAPADEPAPVPPPVDAQLVLKLLDEYADEIEYRTAADSACDTAQYAIYDAAAKETRSGIGRAINALWAAGVEEGRRQLVEESENATKDAVAAGFGCPSCGTILNAKRAGCWHPWHSDNRPYAAGVREGRRQAAAAIRAADTSGWPGGRGSEVEGCRELAAEIAEVTRG